jgi:hypothetical protein
MDYCPPEVNCDLLKGREGFWKNISTDRLPVLAPHELFFEVTKVIFDL